MRVLLVVYDNDSYIHWFPQGLGPRRFRDFRQEFNRIRSVNFPPAPEFSWTPNWDNVRPKEVLRWGT